jgi:hypothetical protein
MKQQWRRQKDLRRTSSSHSGDYNRMYCAFNGQQDSRSKSEEVRDSHGGKGLCHQSIGKD